MTWYQLSWQSKNCCLHIHYMDGRIVWSRNWLQLLMAVVIGRGWEHNCQCHWCQVEGWAQSGGRRVLVNSGTTWLWKENSSYGQPQVEGQAWRSLSESVNECIRVYQHHPTNDDDRGWLKKCVNLSVAHYLWIVLQLKEQWGMYWRISWWCD